MTEGEDAGSLEHTPTWAVAAVCFFMISVSIFLEHSIHLAMKWLKRRHKTVLYDAFGRLKSELMLLGFISLLLTVTQGYISTICIPPEAANRMLPCGRDVSLAAYGHWIYDDGPFVNKSKFISRRLSDNGSRAAHDETPAAMKVVNATDPCASKGKVQLITVKGIEQLSHFIIVLSVMQIVYSVLTVSLGRIKMRRWKVWEKETQTTDFSANDRFRLPRQTTFGRRHTTCTETSPQLLIKCFIRHFFSSVAKTDYHTLRKGFIMAHLSSRQLNNFNFQKYIRHSLDEDFKVVISISPRMWFTVVIFMLVDIHGWHSYMWISFAPLLLIILVGTKLEVIVARMALQLKNQKNMIYGAPLVELDDNNFWFGNPGIVLNLLHLILFLNAFEIAFFIWVTIEFGSDSCYHDDATTIVRIALAVAIQVICSYITLPLYALVSQMGSQFKGEIFNEKVAQVLKQWHIQVRRNRKKKEEHSLDKSITIAMAYEKKGFTFNNNPNQFCAAETSYRSENNTSEITEEHGH